MYMHALRQLCWLKYTLKEPSTIKTEMWKNIFFISKKDLKIKVPTKIQKLTVI